MALDVDKLLEKLPVADGRFRRRMMAGGIVALIAGLTYRKEATLSGGPLELKDLLLSPSLLFVGLVIVYAIGGVVEIFGQLFVIRAVGESNHFVRKTLASDNSRHWIVEWFVKIGKMFVVIYGVYFALAKGIFGKTEYEFVPSGTNVSPEGLQALARMPGKVRDGIVHPLGDNAEYAVQYLERRLDDRSRKFVEAKFRNCREMLVLLTSILVGGLLVLPKYLEHLASSSGGQIEEVSALAIFLLQIAGLLVALLFRGYFLLLHSALSDLIELSASSMEATDEAARKEGVALVAIDGRTPAG